MSAGRRESQSALIWVQGLGAVAALSGMLALVDYWRFGGAHSARLLGVPGAATNAALCLVLLGLAIGLRPSWPSLASLLVWPALILSTLRLVEPFLGLDLDLSQSVLPGVISPRPMSASAAFAIVCLSPALLLAEQRPPWRPWLVQGLALAAAVPMLATLLRYLLGNSLGLDALVQVPVGPDAALGMFAVALAILGSGGRRGLLRVLSGSRSSALVARRLLLATLVAIPLLNFPRVLGERWGWYSHDAGIASSALAAVAVLVACIWWAAAVLRRTDYLRARSEAARRRLLHQLEQTNAGLTEQAVARARRLQLITDNAASCMCYVDRSQRILFCNRAFQALYSRPLDALIGHHLADVVDPIAYPLVHEHVQSALSGQRVNFERRMEGSGGARILRVELVPDRLPSGEVVGLFSSADDITHLRRQEEILRESEARFRSAFDFAPIGVTLVSRQGRFMQANRALCQMLGYSEAELCALTFAEISVAEELVLDTRLNDRLLAGEIESFQIEKRYRRKDGSWLWVLLNVAAVRDSQGQVTYTTAQVQDISARKQAEEELTRSAGLLNQTERTAQIGGWELDTDTQVLSWTEGTYALHDWPRGRDIDLQSVLQLYPESARQRITEALREVASRGTPWEAELPMVTVTGRETWIRVQAQATRVTGRGPLLWGTAQDITPRKRAELALRESEERFRSLLQLTSDWFWEQDEQFRFTELPHFPVAQGHGYSRDEGIGMTRWDLPGVSQSNVDWQAHREICLRHEPYRDFVYSRTGKDGSTVWLSVSGEPVFGPEGRFRGYRGVGRDATEELWAREELRRHRDDLQALLQEHAGDLIRARDEAERANRAKSEFLANMSHELRTPMHAILSFARLGVERIEAGRGELPRLLHYLRNIDAGGERLLRLLNDLLDLSKLEAGATVYHMRAYDLAEAVREAVAEFAELARGRSVGLDFIDAGTSLRAWCDSDRIGQVLRNLISNALKFTPAHKSVTLELLPVTLGGEGPQAPRQAVMLRVTDQGVGIPEGELEEVFDKFVQSSKTRSGAGGTGLGLSICREIVAQHQGRIWAEHVEGGGARVSFLLPCAPDPAQPSAPTLPGS